MNVLAILSLVGVIAFVGFQIYGAITDIAKRKKENNNKKGE